MSARPLHVDLVLAQKEGEFIAQIPRGVQVVTLNRWRFPGFRTFIALPALVRYLRRTRPDALLTGLIRANVVGLWARWLSRTRVRTVITVNHLISHECERGWYSRLMYALARRFYPRAEVIVAASNGVAEELRGLMKVSPGRIRVIYNPAITPDRLEKAAEATNHPWFECGAPPVIVSAARLEEPKDFATLIRAFGAVRRRRNVRMLILGEGPLRSELEALVERLNLQHDVAMPGFTDNPYPFIARAGVFVLSSRWEALPTVLIEALHLGTPVVSSDCPSGPREILHNGRYGRLVPVGDERSMAEALEEVLSAPRSTSPEESWLPYALETVTDQYAGVLFGDAAHTLQPTPDRPRVYAAPQ